MSQQINTQFKAIRSARDTIDDALMNADLNILRSDNKVQLRELGGFLRKGLFIHSQLLLDNEVANEQELLKEVLAEIEIAKSFFTQVERDVSDYIDTLTPISATNDTTSSLSERDALIKDLTNTINHHNNSSLTAAQVANWVGDTMDVDKIQSYIDNYTFNPTQFVSPEYILARWEDCHP